MRYYFRLLVKISICLLEYVVLAQVEELRQKGYEPYAYTWDRSHTARQIQEGYGYLENGEVFTGVAVSLAGRVVARRAFGKLVFLTLRDDSGTIQVCVVVYLFKKLI